MFMIIVETISVAS